MSSPRPHRNHLQLSCDLDTDINGQTSECTFDGPAQPTIHFTCPVSHDQQPGNQVRMPAAAQLSRRCAVPPGLTTAARSPLHAVQLGQPGGAAACLCGAARAQHPGQLAAGGMTAGGVG